MVDWTIISVIPVLLLIVVFSLSKHVINIRNKSLKTSRRHK